MSIEVCCFNVESAATAFDNGADRIEFCRDKASAGLTPEEDDLRKVKNINRNVPVRAMIRQHDRDFSVSNSEFVEMTRSLARLKNEGLADGFVFGILGIGASGASLQLVHG